MKPPRPNPPERPMLFDLAIEFTKTGLFNWDIANDVLLWNRPHALVFGFPPDCEYVSFSEYHKRVHPDDIDRLLTRVAELLEKPEPYTLEYRIIKPDGSVCWLHGRGDFLLDAYGKPLRMAGTTVDVTERKMM